MIEILGYQFDLISLIPALFGAILSLYNFFKMSRPANIMPTEIVNYGIISSSYENSFKIVLPLVLHNDGAKKGIIKNIKIGFKQDGTVKYLDDLLKVRLNELTDDLALRSDWKKFTELGYGVIQPTYPISILSDSSIDLTMIATCAYEEEVIPLDKESEYVIEVYFGKNKLNKITAQFSLLESNIPDDRLIWLPPVSESVPDEIE